MTDEVKQTIKDKTVSIHGREYLTVAGRVELAHADKENKTLSITTELVPADGVILVKATAVTAKGTFTGYSAANPAKAIEKQNPYEVAETSAVGRALGFAGYGLVEGIATADEMLKSAGAEPATKPTMRNPYTLPAAKGDTVQAAKPASLLSDERWESPPSAEDMAGAADELKPDGDGWKCRTCGQPAVKKSGVSKKTSKPWTALFCSTDDKSHTQWL